VQASGWHIGERGMLRGDLKYVSDFRSTQGQTRWRAFKVRVRVSTVDWGEGRGHWGSHSHDERRVVRPAALGAHVPGREREVLGPDVERPSVVRLGDVCIERPVLTHCRTRMPTNQEDN